MVLPRRLWGTLNQQVWLIFSCTRSFIHRLLQEHRGRQDINLTRVPPSKTSLISVVPEFVFILQHLLVVKVFSLLLSYLSIHGVCVFVFVFVFVCVCVCFSCFCVSHGPLSVLCRCGELSLNVQ